VPVRGHIELRRPAPDGAALLTWVAGDEERRRLLLRWEAAAAA
jgi:hypothetical protein